MGKKRAMRFRLGLHHHPAAALKLGGEARVGDAGQISIGGGRRGRCGGLG